MANASGVALELEFGKVPFLTGAAKYAARGAYAGGLRDNQSYFGPHVNFSHAVGETERLMLFDPQTSGGLLLGVPDQKIEDLLQRAAAVDQPLWVIGRARQGNGIRVE
jgi:selenide,water dikinase